MTPLYDMYNSIWKVDGSKPAQKSTERRISVVSSAGTAKERVNMARHKSKARGAAMYLILSGWGQRWLVRTSGTVQQHLWSGCRGARGDSWVTPSVGDTLWLPTKRSKES